MSRCTRHFGVDGDEIVQMKRAWQATTIVFVLFAAWVYVLARGYPFFDRLGPGPGFFPTWLSLALGLLALALLVQVSLGRSAVDPTVALIPDREGGRGVLAILAGLAFVVVLLNPLGFRLTLLLFLLYLPWALGIRQVVPIVVIALLGSFGVFHVFYNWLRVPLPIGGLGI